MKERIHFPPGFRFVPTDEELITFYLKPRVLGQKLPYNIVTERQVYGPNANPWQVFDKDSMMVSKVSSKKIEKVTYVFVNLTKKAKSENKKEGTREQYHKKAGCGTWDGQTKRTEIWDGNDDLIGEKRMLSFEINEIPDMDLSRAGYWRMHEYSLCGVNENIIDSGNMVLCRIILDQSKNPTIKLHSNLSSKRCGKITTVVESYRVNEETEIVERCGVEGMNSNYVEDDILGIESSPSEVEGMNSNYVEDDILGIESSPSEVEGMNSNYVEDDILGIESSPSEEIEKNSILLNSGGVFDGNMQLDWEFSEHCWSANYDYAYLELDRQEDGDLYFNVDEFLNMNEFEFPSYVNPNEEEQAVQDITINLGKRKFEAETAPTMTKKLRL